MGSAWAPHLPSPACMEAPRPPGAGLGPLARTLSCLVGPQNRKATTSGSQSLLLSRPSHRLTPGTPTRSVAQGSFSNVDLTSSHPSFKLCQVPTALRTPASSSLGPGACLLPHHPASLLPPLCPSPPGLCPCLSPLPSLPDTIHCRRLGSDIAAGRPAHTEAAPGVPRCRALRSTPWSPGGTSAGGKRWVQSPTPGERRPPGQLS